MRELKKGKCGRITEGIVGLPRMRGQGILVGEHDLSRFEFPHG